MLRRLLPLALLIPLVLTACSGDDKSTPTITATGTATTEAIATSTAAPPTTTAPADPPVLEWTTVDPDDIVDVPQGTFLLDTETGDLLAVKWSYGSELQSDGRFEGWTPDGAMLLSVEVQGGRAIYAGGVGETPQLIVPTWSGADGLTISSRGQLALAVDNRNPIIDIATGDEIAEAPDPPWGVRTWSPDGETLALEMGSGCSASPAALALWGVDDGGMIEIQNANFVSWSEDSSSIVYTMLDEADETGCRTQSLRLRNLDSGEDWALGEEGNRAIRSPSGRYLLLPRDLLLPESGGSREDVSIYDLEQRRIVTTVEGATSPGWLNSNRLYFAGNLCADPVSDIFTMNPDGSDPIVLTQERRHDGTFTLSSPDGRHVALSEYHESDERRYVRIVDTESGAEQEFPVGKPSLGYFGDAAWSPDGRLVVVYLVGGRDGPCMTFTGTETQIVTF